MARYIKAECKCGHGRKPASFAGIYAGYCAEEIEFLKEQKEKELVASGGRPEGRKYPRTRRSRVPILNHNDDGVTNEIKRNSDDSKQLSRAAKEIVKQAEKLEAALVNREDARTRARIALKDFNIALEFMSRVARAKLEGQKIVSDGENGSK
jgi:IMP dehydrogenase/GMP reductase